MNMRRFLPTYKQAQEMVNINGDSIFYENKYVIEGYNISVFNYRYVTYDNFITPIDGTDYNAFEMRGLTFVFNTDGTIYNRYLLMNKFFNLNQCPISLYENVKNKKIKSIYNKADGSLISFISLPNGNVVTKTKMGFDNTQVLEVNKLCDQNKNIKIFIEEMTKKGYITMWEYVSYKNKIVLDYDDSNLILLKVRNNKTGDYVDVEKFRNKGFDVVENKTDKFADLESIILWCKSAVNVEGCVVTFEDDLMIKMKTEWYFNIHKLMDSITREDRIIDLILSNNLDDVISKLDPIIDFDLIEKIKIIEQKVIKYIKTMKNEILLLTNGYDGTMKDFAIKNINNEHFHLAMSVLKGYPIYDVIDDHIYKMTNKLYKAINFLKKIEI